jgi:endonuclease YncB( thermonuclease family)
MKNVIVSILCAALCIGAAQAATKPKKEQKPPEPKEFTGQVSRVVDGDTLWVKSAAESEPVVVRIEGIDAPESCQPGGSEATQALTKLALNRNVTVHVAAKDDWGRTVGKVLDGTVDVGDRMVRDGHAWSMRFKYDRGPYMAEERMAIALKRGVHAEGAAVLPRDFRQRHGECEGSAPKHAGAASGAAPATTPAAAVVAATAPAVVVASARRCDGRTYCSQMSSCEEAKWFAQNCPGMKMDGNRDGVPCEKQHCR